MEDRQTQKLLGIPRNTKKRRKEHEESAPSRKQMDLNELLRQQYDRSEHCDVSLKVGEDRTLAHRCVLAAACPYVRRTFPKNVRSWPKEVDLSDKTESIKSVIAVLEFIYHGEIKITKNEVQGIFQVSRFFEMTDLRASCVQLLLKHLSLGTALWVWAVSYELSIYALEYAAKKLAQSRFHDTLIMSKQALEVKPKHLLYFLDQGLGKFCTKEKLEKFLWQWYKNEESNRIAFLGELRKAAGLPDDVAEASSSRSMTDEKPTMEEASSLSIDETTGETLEEILYCENEQTGLYLIYRPEKKVWLQVKVPEEVKAYVPQINIYIFGLGASAEYICVPGTCHNYFLVNIFSNEVIDLPRLYEDFGFGEEQRQCVHTPICFTDGQLYFLREYLFLQKNQPEGSKKGNQWERQSGFANALGGQKMWKFCIDRFDMEKRRWTLFCESAAEPGGVSDYFRAVYRLDGTAYFFSIRDQAKLLIWHFTPSSGRLKRLPNPPENIPLRALLADPGRLFDILGTADEMLLKLRKNALVYKINENSWELRQFPKDQPSKSTPPCSLKMYGKTRGDIYLLYAEKNAGFMDMGIYNPFTKQLTDVPPFPTRVEPMHTVVQLVRTHFLDLLEEASCEDSMGECTFSPNQIQRLLQAFKKEWREEVLEAMSHGERLDEAGWSSDEEDSEEEEDVDAELFKELFMRSLLRRAFWLPTSF